MAAIDDLPTAIDEPWVRAGPELLNWGCGLSGVGKPKAGLAVEKIAADGSLRNENFRSMESWLKYFWIGETSGKKRGARLGDGIFLVATGGGARKEVSSDWKKNRGSDVFKSTGVEEDGGYCPLRCDPKQETTEGKQPEAAQETTQETVWRRAESSHHASGRV
ncbi:hypothetical protein NDU88_003145 [Pleurodeles waltl]|uniref:Uncharacterized protein n=1 Tax=Pleurodeles waltl TaxID=8319 RepID=A0AAV7QEW6_PLEWA|nr:hypothetical protein NDU88_003145 [Pleurodeles waltl]